MLFRRLQEEGRILHDDWSQYDLGHVVFQPKRMSGREREEGYIWVHEQVYALKRSYPKLREHIWREEPNTTSSSLKWKVTARLISHLSLADWDRNRFILQVIPDMFDPNLDLQVSNIICSAHHFIRQYRRGIVT